MKWRPGGDDDDDDDEGDGHDNDDDDAGDDDDMSRCGNESYTGVREMETGDPEESRRMIDSRIGALHSEVTAHHD